MTATRNRLAELIDETREANKWSDPYVAQRATSAGHQLTKSNLSRIRLAPIKVAVPEQIKAIAAGLGLSVETVLRAVLETLGLPAGAPSLSVEAAVKADPSLSVPTKEAVLAVIRASRRSENATATTRPTNLGPKVTDIIGHPRSSTGVTGGESSFQTVDIAATRRRKATKAAHTLSSDATQLGQVVDGDASVQSSAHESARKLRDAEVAAAVAPSERDGRGKKSRRTGGPRP